MTDILHTKKLGQTPLTPLPLLADPALVSLSDINKICLSDECPTHRVPIRNRRS